MRPSFAFVLFRGQDDKPELYCGMSGSNPSFAPYREGGFVTGALGHQPWLFWTQTEAEREWKLLEERGIKVELLQLLAGWCQFERTEVK